MFEKHNSHGISADAFMCYKHCNTYLCGSVAPIGDIARLPCCSFIVCQHLHGPSMAQAGNRQSCNVLLGPTHLSVLAANQNAVGTESTSNANCLQWVCVVRFDFGWLFGLVV